MIILFVILKINKLELGLEPIGLQNSTFTLHQQRTVSGEFDGSGNGGAQRFSDRSEIDCRAKGI